MIKQHFFMFSEMHC